ncbi:MAG: adenosylcobalamin-dependent ribonucleoside-diphosphate reductase [Pseudomonadota bacterium]
MNDHFRVFDNEFIFAQPVARQIWKDKYAYRRDGVEMDLTVRDTWQRVANGLSAAEPDAKRDAVFHKFYNAMEGFRLLPGGRILSGAGTERDVTLFNTFVMRTIPDALSGIMDTIKDAALTMKMGGGIGFDFSTIRPQGSNIKGLDCPAAGPLAVMDICDSVCAMLVTGMGRGAMMATLRCDHPDIEGFVNAKADRARFRNFNLSVLVTDDFVEAVKEGRSWALNWNGKTVRTIDAKALWGAIMERTYAAAEPGVLFIDRINRANPLGYAEEIAATNSCAEQPLPPNGACPLASINLAQLVKNPFRRDAYLDLLELRDLVATAVHLLDNAIDVSKFALPAQEQEARDKRRIGVGVTGVADALIMVGLRYGSDPAVATFGRWMHVLKNAAYAASARRARERGSFPLYNHDAHCDRGAFRGLDFETRALIRDHGLRNGLLTTIAPTGTTSMFAGNVSSGIEPVFATSFTRRITRPNREVDYEVVKDYAVWLYHQTYGADAPLTDAFVTAMDLTPDDHVRMQATAQQWVDSGISKTVNCPEDIDFQSFKDVYWRAHETGCKGCTTYRPNDVTGSVLSA